MSDFTVKSDSVDVEAIMRQIRARVREKRGADYTERELQELANVKLERFMDPKGIRSDLVEQFRRRRTVSAPPPNYEFEDTTIYETHRGMVRTIRRLLNPVLKLFFNPNTISGALHVQAKVNAEFHQRFRQREDMDPLYYELVHNLVLEVTRLGIEVHNMKMRVESVSSRIDFDERRARALEGVVQYRQPQAPRVQPAAPTPPPPRIPPAAMPLPTQGGETASVSAAAPQAVAARPADQPGDGERRRRRRRRRRRPGHTLGDQAGAAGTTAQPASTPDADADASDWVAEGGSDDGNPDQ